MTRVRLFAALWLAFGVGAAAQDLSSLIERAPGVSMVMAKALEGVPAFSARAQVEAASLADPAPSSAVGAVEFQKGRMRWQIRLGDVRSPQLTPKAIALMKKLNGDSLLLLTRADLGANYLVLDRARACLAEKLPVIRSSSKKALLGTETIDGVSCSKESFLVIRADGVTNAVTVWRARKVESTPRQVQIRDAGDVFTIRFRDVHARFIAPDRFQAPAGLARYESFEDLLQSILLDEMRKRMGLN